LPEPTGPTMATTRPFGIFKLVFWILNTFSILSTSEELEAGEEPATKLDAEATVGGMADFLLAALLFFFPLPFSPSGSGGGASQVKETSSNSRAFLSSTSVTCSSGKDSASNTS